MKRSAAIFESSIIPPVEKSAHAILAEEEKERERERERETKHRA